MYNLNGNPLENFVYDGGYTSIFRTLCCIGDSLSSGEHESLMYSIAAINYQQMINEQLELLKKSGDFTEEKEREFIKGVDHKLYSQVNTDLLDKMIETFNCCL